MSDRIDSEPAWDGAQTQFRNLIEAAVDGVLVVSLEGLIIYANPSACALLGHRHGELIGRPFGVPTVPGETTEIDLWRGGEIAIAEMRASELDWLGQPAYLASLRDITDRRQAEAAARETAATLRSFYDGAAMMMAVVELVGEELLVVSANAAMTRFLGAPPGRIENNLASQLQVPPATLGEWTAGLRQAEATRSPAHFDYATDSQSGRTWFSVTVGFISRTPAGRPQFSFVVEDVTERKRSEETLRDADRRKDEFLAMLAHELRNPLAAIAGAVRLVQRVKTDQERSRTMEVIDRQCMNLSRLIDDLLDVSRITTGKIQLRKACLDLGPILDRAIACVRPTIDNRKHTLDVAIEPGLKLDADPLRIEQIVVNLLSNAAKYTKNGGRIWLTAEHQAGKIVIKVRDNGIGIPTEMLPRVFELFTQVDASLNRADGGLGIGLTLVRKLAELHGGTAEVTSDGVGQGTEFTVTLAASPATESDGEANKRQKANPPTSAFRILVVDDNLDLAQGMAHLLQLSGHCVWTALDGHSAIDMARTVRPDFVLLDIGMPGMNGYQVAEGIRQEAGLERTKLIAVTGYGYENDRRRSLEAGFHHHLVKPVNFDELLDLIV